MAGNKVSFKDVLVKHVLATSEYVSSSYLNQAVNNGKLPSAEKINGRYVVDMDEALALLAKKGTRTGVTRTIDPDIVKRWILESQDVIYRNTLRNQKRESDILNKYIPRWESLTGETWDDSAHPSLEERYQEYLDTKAKEKAEKAKKAAAKK